MNTLPLLVGLSGGETSAYMSYLLNKKWKDTGREVVYCFANTGREREKTLVFVDRISKEWGIDIVWIEAVVNPEKRKGTGFRIVDFETADRSGQPFEQVIKKFGIPNKVFPHCSRELKTRPMTKFAKSLGWEKYETAIGIRYDEQRRVKDMKKSIKDGKSYPLILDFPSDKSMVKNFWAKQPFQLGLKSYQGNCDLCWKKSLRKLLTIITEGPEVVNWWNEMELKYSDLVTTDSGGIPPFYFFREHRRATDLVELSKEKFSKWVDQTSLQQIMFFDPELDVTDGCEEECSAF